MRSKLVERGELGLVRDHLPDGSQRRWPYHNAIALVDRAKDSPSSISVAENHSSVRGEYGAQHEPLKLIANGEHDN